MTTSLHSIVHWAVFATCIDHAAEYGHLNIEDLANKILDELRRHPHLAQHINSNEPYKEL